MYGNRTIKKSVDTFNYQLHVVFIVICAALLLGDFITTSYALSIGSVSAPGGTVTLNEGNPLMAMVVGNPLAFLVSKILLLGVVTGAAYVLRDNGVLAYFPYLIIGGLYLFVLLNNLSLLLPAM